MTASQRMVAHRIPCNACPLARLSRFRGHSSKELAFLSSFKTGELNVEAQTTILEEGAHSAHLFTLLSGWAFRYKTLEDGRRQILNYVMPGDLVGLQGTLMKEMQHSVEALTQVSFCVFQRGRLTELFADHPSLAFDMTWLAAREERLLDEHLLSIGRRSALERTAYLLAYLGTRASASGLTGKTAITIPITQRHVADTLGLSVVHTNKTLAKLAGKKLVRWHDRICEIRDIAALAEIAEWDPTTEGDRPYI